MTILVFIAGIVVGALLANFSRRRVQRSLDRALVRADHSKQVIARMTRNEGRRLSVAA